MKCSRSLYLIFLKIFIKTPKGVVRFNVNKTLLLGFFVECYRLIIISAITWHNIQQLSLNLSEFTQFVQPKTDSPKLRIRRSFWGVYCLWIWIGSKAIIYYWLKYIFCHAWKCTSLGVVYDKFQIWKKNLLKKNYNKGTMT